MPPKEEEMLNKISVFALLQIYQSQTKILLGAKGKKSQKQQKEKIKKTLPILIHTQYLWFGDKQKEMVSEWQKLPGERQKR